MHSLERARSLRASLGVGGDLFGAGLLGGLISSLLGLLARWPEELRGVDHVAVGVGDGAAVHHRRDGQAAQAADDTVEETSSDEEPAEAK